MEHWDWLARTELVLGREAMLKLRQSRVIVIGLGGVGSFAAELIARGGVGHMTLVDGDTVDPSNRNRQLPALATTHGQYKADLMAERIKAINPEIELHIVKKFLQPEDVLQLLEEQPYDYLVEAIDSVTPKLTVIKAAYEKRIPFVSSMGAGGKLDPTKVQIAKIEKSYNCPLAHLVRKRLRKMGIRKGFKVVFSPELPIKESLMHTDGSNFKRSAYGTMSYLPAVFGCCCASVVLRDLVEGQEKPLAG